MQSTRAEGLYPPIDPARDHVLGPPAAEITLVEYGSYVCTYCHTAHEVIRRLRDRFGDRLRYVYRHLPLTDRAEATRAAAAVIVGLVLGKLAGIFIGAWLAVRLGIGAKPDTYNWRQVAGTGALGGIGFTMSLFIAGQALTGDDFGAAKVAVFAASLIAGGVGVAILWKRAPATAIAVSDAVETGTPVEAAREAD